MSKYQMLLDALGVTTETEALERCQQMIAGLREDGGTPADYGIPGHMPAYERQKARGRAFCHTEGHGFRWYGPRDWPLSIWRPDFVAELSARLNLIGERLEPCGEDEDGHRLYRRVPL